MSVRTVGRLDTHDFLVRRHGVEWVVETKYQGKIAGSIWHKLYANVRWLAGYRHQGASGAMLLVHAGSIPDWGLQDLRAACEEKGVVFHTERTFHTWLEA